MLTAARRSLPRWLVHYRGLLLNLAFLIYLAALQPWVLRRLTRLVDRAPVDGALALAFLAAAGLETVGLWLKAPGMQARLRHAQRPVSALVVWAAWIAHALLNLATLMLAAQALGIDAAAPESELTGGALMGIGAALVVKELLVLFNVFLPLSSPASTEPLEDSEQAAERLDRREAWGDLLIFPFAALGFTLLWDFVVGRTAFRAGNLGLALVDLAGAAMIYAIAQFAARGIYLIEELSSPALRRTILVCLAGFVISALGWVTWM